MERVANGFTLLVNPSRSNGRPFWALPKSGSGSRSPELRPSGFTLAETLITLVIIGVVAALTVPTLIVKYQKEQTVTKLKKAYSALSQTTQRAIADNGPVTTWELGEVNNAEDSKIFFNKYIAPYLSLSVSAKTKAEGNWNGTRGTLNGNSADYDNTYTRAYLSDGTSLTFKIDVKNETQHHVNFFIDINGDKKPNKVGKDIFSFVYCVKHPNKIQGKLVPNGEGSERTNRTTLLGTTHSSCCNKNKNGYYCSALIMTDGWKIADDYPW